MLAFGSRRGDFAVRTHRARKAMPETETETDTPACDAADALSVSWLVKAYRLGDERIPVLQGPSLTIGCVSAALAFVIGNWLGAISVRFRDHFTLFDSAFRISWPATWYISGLCAFTCIAASVYPAMVANRPSSAESYHYD
jgi:hypothetical protein